MGEPLGERHLDGDQAVEVGVVGQIDPPEATLAEDADHPVTADLRKGRTGSSPRLRAMRGLAVCECAAGSMARRPPCPGPANRLLAPARPEASRNA